MNFGIGQLFLNQDSRNLGSNPQKKSRKFNLERRRSFEFIALCSSRGYQSWLCWNSRQLVVAVERGAVNVVLLLLVR